MWINISFLNLLFFQIIIFFTVLQRSSTEECISQNIYCFFFFFRIFYLEDMLKTYLFNQRECKLIHICKLDIFWPCLQASFFPFSFLFNPTLNHKDLNTMASQPHCIACYTVRCDRPDKSHIKTASFVFSHILGRTFGQLNWNFEHLTLHIHIHTEEADLRWGGRTPSRRVMLGICGEPIVHLIGGMPDRWGYGCRQFDRACMRQKWVKLSLRQL